MKTNVRCEYRKQESEEEEGEFEGQSDDNDNTYPSHGLPPSADRIGTCCYHPPESWAQLPPTAMRDYHRPAPRCLVMHQRHQEGRDTARTVTGHVHTGVNAWVYPWAGSVLVLHLVAATAAGTESFEAE